VWPDLLHSGHNINSSGKLVWVAVLENVIQSKNKFKENEFNDLASFNRYAQFQQKSLELYELQTAEELDRTENAQFFASLQVTSVVRCSVVVASLQVISVV
jgi:hypothetical protein